MNLTVEPLSLEQWPALEDLFGRAGASNGCWCMYWRIGPRYRDRPRAANRDDLRELAASGSPPGLLAFDGDLAVGPPRLRGHGAAQAGSPYDAAEPRLMVGMC